MRRPNFEYTSRVNVFTKMNYWICVTEINHELKDQPLKPLIYLYFRLKTLMIFCQITDVLFIVKWSLTNDKEIKD